MIAIDAMGGDFAPYVVVEGALKAARRGITIGLYGDKTKIFEVLDTLDQSWHRYPITIMHCSESILMADEPGRSILHKKDSSLIRAVKAVADDTAQAVVSAGNSGAALVASIMEFGKLSGICRPAIGGFLPTRNDSVFCIDLGANVDCKPEYLQQFALMGSAYVQLTKGIKRPKIALLANGTEPSKGNKIIQQARHMLEQSSLDFIGNCEPYDILNGVADVVVCEGFSGNVMLKSMESTLQIVTQWLKNEGSRSLLARFVGLLGAPVFKRLKKHLKHVQRGGALLLGATKPLIIAHGSANAQAIEDAILFADNVVTQQLHVHVNRIVNDLLVENNTINKHQETATVHETSS